MNKVAYVIKSLEKKDFPFIASKGFYTSIGINKKRWGLIFRKQISPTQDELYKIADYFKINIKELI